MEHRGIIPEDRPLTPEETQLLHWLLSHGTPGAEAMVPQIERAHVTGRCGCGCATVCLQVDGHKRDPKLGVEPVADFLWHTDAGHLCGAICFAQSGRLVELEIWSVDGLEIPARIPAPGQLFPYSEFGRTQSV